MLYSMQDVQLYQDRYHREDFHEPAKSHIYIVKRDQKLQSLQKRIGQDWLESGQIIKEFHDGDLWREIGFESFTAWVEERTSHSRDYAYKAMRIVAQLDHLLEKDAGALDGMTMANASTIARLPQEKRTDEVVEMAHAMEPRALEEELDRRHPGFIDPDGTQVWSQRVPKSLMVIINGAIEAAKINENTSSTSVALEKIMSHYLTCTKRIVYNSSEANQ